MNYKTKSKLSITLTLIIMLLFAFSVTTMGAYATPAAVKVDVESNATGNPLESGSIIQEKGVYYILSDGATETDKPITVLRMGTS